MDEGKCRLPANTGGPHFRLLGERRQDDVIRQSQRWAFPRIHTDRATLSPKPWGFGVASTGHTHSHSLCPRYHGQCCQPDIAH